MSRTLKGLAWHATGLALTLIFLFPLIGMLAGSLREPGQPPPTSVELLPDPVSWGNYTTLFDLLPFGRYLLNSVLFAAAAVPLTLAAAGAAGFALSRMPSTVRATAIVFSVVLLLIPVTALWLTRFALFRWLGMINTPMAILMPAMMGTSPLFVLLFFTSFRRVPGELIDSARLDGATTLQTLTRVAWPLATPTTVAVAVLAFMEYWGDFIHPLLYLKSQSLYTLPVGLQQLLVLDKSNWPLLLCGATVLTLPAVALFLLAQRYFLGEERLAGLGG